MPIYASLTTSKPSSNSLVDSDSAEISRGRWFAETGAAKASRAVGCYRVNAFLGSDGDLQ